MTDKIKRRSSKETSSVASFGVGKWVKGVYPISRVTYFEIAEPTRRQRRETELATSQRREKEDVQEVDEEAGWIKFKLPATVRTKKQIDEIAKDAIRKSVLLFERDLSMITEHYFGTMKKMKVAFESRSKKDAGSASSSRPAAFYREGDALDEEFAMYFNNPAFFKKVDVLEELFFPKQPSKPDEKAEEWKNDEEEQKNDEEEKKDDEEENDKGKKK